MRAKIKHHATRYNEKWRKQDNKIIAILKNYFFLTIPHVIPTALLVLLFPSKWLAIIITGILLPDFSFKYPLRSERGVLKFLKSLNYFSFISHFTLLAVIIILLFNQEYAVFISGLIHILLDLIGF